MEIIKGFKSQLYHKQMGYREREAKKLWSNYNPQNEEKFWEAYEALLGKKTWAQNYSTKKALPKQPSFSRPTKATIATQTFYPNTKFLIGRVVTLLIPLVIMVVSTVQAPPASLSGILVTVIFPPFPEQHKSV